MKNLKNAIVNNRKETKAINASSFTGKKEYVLYCNTIEELRLKLSEFVAKNRDGLTDKKVEEMKNEIFLYMKLCKPFYNLMQKGLVLENGELESKLMNK